VLGDPDAVEHERNQVEAGQVGGEQLRQACSVAATNRRETADLEVPVAACSTWLPTGSSPCR
jgi:hypothetical protein